MEVAAAVIAALIRKQWNERRARERCWCDALDPVGCSNLKVGGAPGAACSCRCHGNGVYR